MISDRGIGPCEQVDSKYGVRRTKPYSSPAHAKSLIVRAPKVRYGRYLLYLK